MTIIWTGLAFGSLYTLIAVVFNIGMAQSAVFNFAAPQTVMIGAFISYELGASRGVPAVFVLATCILVGALIGALVEVVAIRPLSVGGHGALVTTVGAAFVIEGAAYVIWGEDIRRQDFLAGERTFTLLGGRVATVDIVAIVAAVLVVTAMHLVTHRTRWGLYGRAATSDREVAMLRGINVPAGKTSAFAVAGALGCCVGVLAGPMVYVGFSLGTVLIIYAFVALAVGGIGSYWGCLAGGLSVGLFQALSDRYLGGTYTLSAIFLVLLATLLVRPTGLLGVQKLRMV
ncbi:branched-chain amino acid ABC transporter permease [Dactylosporangium sp. CA-233914]|uniref:branched-chain amino acid ABC transporter permease n=1 Tax=Dactylosporangium sp. CA-233914 TaxID=3239934 RepID=UPI003D8FE2D8